MLGSGSPAFVFPFVGAEKGAQMLFGEVEAVVVHQPCGHGEVYFGKGGFGLEGFLEMLEGFHGVGGEQGLTLFELVHGFLVVDGILCRNHTGGKDEED